MSAKSPNRVDRHIGIKIRLQRCIIGLSQERLGKRLGITCQELRKYENGQDRVGAGRLQDIAHALGVTASYLLEGQTPSALSAENRTAVQRLLETQEGMELASAFVKIENPALRRVLLDLIKAAISDKGSQT